MMRVCTLHLCLVAFWLPLDVSAFHVASIRRSATSSPLISPRSDLKAFAISTSRARGAGTETKRDTVSTSNKVDTLPISLLSLDGGGIKGALSSRLLAYTLQYLMAENGGLPNSKWVKNLREYVKTFEPCYGALWTVWAQQMDLIGVEPQVHRYDGSSKKKWIEFSIESEADKPMIESILKIDLAFKYYLAHVL